MFLYNNCCLILSLAMTCRYKSFKKQLKYIKQIKISIGNAKHNVNCKSSNTFTDSIFLVTVVVPYTSINKIKS